jgi:type I restriction enzyme S subunit
MIDELKRYPAYKDSDIESIGEIPEGWSLKKLKNVCKVNPNKSEIYITNDDEITFIPMENILSVGILDTSIVKNLSEVKDGYTYFREEDIILAKVTPCFENGNIAIAKGLCNKIGFGTTELHVIRAKKESNNRFIFYLVQSNRFKLEGIASMYGVAGLKRIPADFISNFKFALPSLEEQILIANFLEEKTSEIDFLITDKEKLIKLLDEKRQAIITEAVTKGLNSEVRMKNSGVDWIGEIPEHWEVKRLKNIANSQTSNVDKKSKEGEETVLLCNYVDVYYLDKITDEIEFMKATAKSDQIKKFTLKKNDVLITKDSESPLDIAIPTWVAMELDRVLCGYHLCQIRPQRGLDGRYLFYSFKSEKIREQFYSYANGVTRFGLSKDSIKNGLFVVPPYEEQVIIGDFLYKMNIEYEDTIELIKNQILKLKQYRQSLIYEAVTGKIDVRDYDRVTS